MSSPQLVLARLLFVFSFQSLEPLSRWQITKRDQRQTVVSNPPGSRYTYNVLIVIETIIRQNGIVALPLYKELWDAIKTHIAMTAATQDDAPPVSGWFVSEPEKTTIPPCVKTLPLQFLLSQHMLRSYYSCHSTGAIHSSSDMEEASFKSGSFGRCCYSFDLGSWSSPAHAITHPTPPLFRSPRFSPVVGASTTIGTLCIDTSLPILDANRPRVLDGLPARDTDSFEKLSVR